MPLKFYILDSADRVISNGSTPIHDCQVDDLFDILYFSNEKQTFKTHLYFKQK